MQLFFYSKTKNKADIKAGRFSSSQKRIMVFFSYP